MPSPLLSLPFHGCRWPWQHWAPQKAMPSAQNRDAGGAAGGAAGRLGNTQAWLEVSRQCRAFSVAKCALSWLPLAMAASCWQSAALGRGTLVRNMWLVGGVGRGQRVGVSLGFGCAVVGRLMTLMIKFASSWLSGAMGGDLLHNQACGSCCHVAG